MPLPAILTDDLQPLFLPTRDRKTFTRKILKIEIPDQQADNWCWAAVAVGIANAYGDTGLTQCQVATLLFHSEVPAPQCCLEDEKDNCDKLAALSDVLALPGHDHLDEALDPQNFQFIIDQIDDGRPIAVGVERLDSNGDEAGGHFAVITGYLFVENAAGARIQEYVYFDDPLAKRGVRSATSFQTRSDGKWKFTYKTKGTALVSKVPFRVDVFA